MPQRLLLPVHLCSSAALLTRASSAARSFSTVSHRRIMTQVRADAFDRVLAGNKSYARRCGEHEPQLWQSLAKGQAPDVLWFGCGDSRVPETTICDCKPGDIFVHRNIANIIPQGDLSSESIIDFAVGAVKVKKIVVCGHTKCGGAVNSLTDADLGPALNNWLQPLRDLRRKHQAEIDALDSIDDKANRLAEYNVRKSVETIVSNPTVQKAMAERGVTVHGVLFDIVTGELKVIDADDGESLSAAPWSHR
ncbi:carbonic anhydrase [Phyllosticta capitalensis]